MNDRPKHVYIGSNNNGVRTLLTPAAAKTIEAMNILVQDGNLLWSDIWETFSHEGVRGIATFSESGNPKVTGTFDDFERIVSDIRRAGGQVTTFRFGSYVPHSNGIEDEKPSPTIGEFRYLVGLEPVTEPANA